MYRCFKCIYDLWSNSAHIKYTTIKCNWFEYQFNIPQYHVIFTIPLSLTEHCFDFYLCFPFSVFVLVWNEIIYVLKLAAVNLLTMPIVACFVSTSGFRSLLLFSPAHPHCPLRTCLSAVTLHSCVQIFFIASGLLRWKMMQSMNRSSSIAQSQWEREPKCSVRVHKIGTRFPLCPNWHVNFSLRQYLALDANILWCVRFWLRFLCVLLNVLCSAHTLLCANL